MRTFVTSPVFSLQFPVTSTRHPPSSFLIAPVRCPPSFPCLPVSRIVSSCFCFFYIYFIDFSPLGSQVVFFVIVSVLFSPSSSLHRSASRHAHSYIGSSALAHWHIYRRNTILSVRVHTYLRDPHKHSRYHRMHARVGIQYTISRFNVLHTVMVKSPP